MSSTCSFSSIYRSHVTIITDGNQISLTLEGMQTYPLSTIINTIIDTACSDPRWYIEIVPTQIQWISQAHTQHYDTQILTFEGS